MIKQEKPRKGKRSEAFRDRSGDGFPSKHKQEEEGSSKAKRGQVTVAAKFLQLH